eukprot:scaffold24178_cov21-Tisochrysis_lutea.AAC.4
MRSLSELSFIRQCSPECTGQSAERPIGFWCVCTQFTPQVRKPTAAGFSRAASPPELLARLLQVAATGVHHIDEQALVHIGAKPPVQHV